MTFSGDGGESQSSARPNSDVLDRYDAGRAIIWLERLRRSRVHIPHRAQMNSVTEVLLIGNPESELSFAEDERSSSMMNRRYESSRVKPSSVINLNHKQASAICRKSSRNDDEQACDYEALLNLFFSLSLLVSLILSFAT